MSERKDPTQQSPSNPNPATPRPDLAPSRETVLAKAAAWIRKALRIQPKSKPTEIK